MEILHPELKYAIRRHRGLSKRPKERLVGKHKRRKEKYARTIRKHLGRLLGTAVFTAALVTGMGAAANPDTQRIEKPNAPQVDLPDTEEAEETMADLHTGEIDTSHIAQLEKQELIKFPNN